MITGELAIGPDDTVYRALRHCFTVSTADPDVDQYVRYVLRPLEDENAEPAHHYEYLGNAERGRISVDGVELRSFVHISHVIERMVTHINLAAGKSWAGMTVHGGAVADENGHAALLVGRSGAGKSTLTAGLVRRGLAYMTDEVIALDNELERVIAYPRPISLKPGSFDLLPDVRPPAEFSKHSSRNRFVDPTSIGPGRVVHGARVGVLVLLAESTNHGGELEVVEQSRATYVRDVVSQSFGSGLTISRDTLDALASWVARTPHLQLRGGAPTEREDIVLRQLAALSNLAPPAPSPHPD